MSDDGFIDKAGDAARKLFGNDEQRYTAGSAGEQPRKVVDYPMGGDGTSSSHYGAQGTETRIEGVVSGDRGQYDDDPHYQEARASQMGAFDRDYGEYRREHGSADLGQRDFGIWRTMRQGQRESLAGVREHMEVVGNDGAHVGTVDKVHGEQIILTRKDPAAGGVHHAIPVSWIQGIGEKLMLNIHGDEARRKWSEAQSSGNTGEGASSLALGESPSQGSDGPHILDRSFSGTYDKT